MEISCFAYRLRTAVLLLAFSYINIFDFEPQNLAAQHFNSFFHQTFHSATALPRCAGLDSNAESSVLVKEALCEFINLKKKKEKRRSSRECGGHRKGPYQRALLRQSDSGQ